MNMTIDWDLLFDLNLEQLTAEKAEMLYDILIEYIPDNEDNIIHLRRLFIVSRSVMQVKALQADVYYQELMESSEKNYDKNEVDLLKKELAIYKQSEANGGDIALKLREANDQLFQLKNSVDSKDNELIKTKRKVEELQNLLDRKDKEVAVFKSEVDSLKDEIDNQRQFDQQLSERQEPIEKLREKNKQIQQLIDELKDLEIVNLELANQVKTLKIQLNSATNEMQISCDQMEMTRQQMQELKELNNKLVAEKTFYLDEIKILRESFEKYESEDESIAAKFNEKAEQLRKLIQLKDDEIMHLKSTNTSNKNAEQDEEYESKLIEQINVRDKQLEMFRTQLNEAVKDMENQTQLIQKLMQDKKNDDHIGDDNEKVESLKNMIKFLEEEMQTKDEELVEIRNRLNLYEKGEYGLSEALKELNDLKKQVNAKDRKIEDLVQQSNELHAQLEESMDYIDKHCSDINETHTKDNSMHTKRDKIKLLELQHQLLKLEEEKINLSDALRVKRRQESAHKDKEEFEINRLKIRLKEVEVENYELSIGMKEILNSLRESDSRSDVIIECPSLERICQLMESRTLSGDITNIIVLKAELDLVRGHNEQLRIEMRKLRNDYLKLIAQYTEEMLNFDADTRQDNQQQTKYEDKIIQVNLEPHRTEIQSEKSTIIENDSQKIIENKRISFANQETQTSLLFDDNSTDKTQFNKNILNKRISFANQETQTLLLFDNNSTDETQFNKNISYNRISYTNQETKTLLLFDDNRTGKTQFNKKILYNDIFTQTEDYYQKSLPTKQLCANCSKLLKIFDSLKNCVERLQENISSTEAKYSEQLNILHLENKNLIININEYREKLQKTEVECNKKEEKIKELESKSVDNSMIQINLEDQTISSDYANYKPLSKDSLRSDTQPRLSLGCKTILENIINCLQARLDHKDESIKQYQNMLQEAKQNFENEMIRLIDSNQNENQINTINFSKMIDNEELQSALQSCVNELEISKSELNAKISHLEEELERTTIKMKIYQNENEQLKLKRFKPHANLKKEVEQLKDECNAKEDAITNLKKILKDERSIRSAKRKPKEVTVESSKTAKDDHYQDFINSKTEIDSLNAKIKDLELLKWEQEKSLKELKEQTKRRLKEKDNELTTVEKQVEKLKARVIKFEKDNHLLLTKINKIDANKSNVNKAIQVNFIGDDYEKRKLRRELKKLQNDNKSLEEKSVNLTTNLSEKNQIEAELKILLQESLKREKLATIYEENMDYDIENEKLLQENAQLKVELRMAEFELSKHLNRE